MYSCSEFKKLISATKIQKFNNLISGNSYKFYLYATKTTCIMLNFATNHNSFIFLIFNGI